MSHIVEFSINGLAGRKKPLHLKLNRNVNIFFGLNGSGKTSLLKILHSAMQGDAGLLQGVPFTQASVSFYSKKFDKVYTRHVEQIPENLNRAAEHASTVDYGTIYIDATGAAHVRPSPKITWTTRPKLPPNAASIYKHRYLPTSRLYLASDIPIGDTAPFLGRPNPLSEEQLDQYFARSVESLWARYSAEILKQVRKAQEDGLANILKAILATRKQPRSDDQEVDPGTAYQRVAAFLDRQGSPSILGSLTDFENRYSRNSQLRSVVSDINEVEKRIEEAMRPKERLQALISRMFTGSKRIRFGDQSITIEGLDNTTISLSSLSSGEKQVLRILIETLLAEENSLMIDEPEISMHVDWQKSLVAAMCQLNPETQLILATHSPEIMADVNDSQIFRI